MPRLLWAILAASLVLVPFPVWAEDEYGTTTDDVSAQLEALSRKVDELQRQNRQVLENQTKILQELETLKVRIRRS